MRVKFRGEHVAGQTGGDVRFQGRHRWIRLAAYFGSAAGSHKGFWRTRYGDLRGWNLRLGSLERCLTIFVHTKREELLPLPYADHPDYREEWRP